MTPPQPERRETVRDDDATHDWFVPEGIGYECCRKCGIVRRRDRKNKACKGVVRIGLRAIAAALKSGG